MIEQLFSLYNMVSRNIVHQFQLAFGPYSMVLWMAFALLFLAYMLLCLPDTRGKSQKRIQQELDGPFFMRNFISVSSKQNADKRDNHLSTVSIFTSDSNITRQQ